MTKNRSIGSVDVGLRDLLVGRPGTVGSRSEVNRLLLPLHLFSHFKVYFDQIFRLLQLGFFLKTFIDQRTV